MDLGELCAADGPGTGRGRARRHLVDWEGGLENRAYVSLYAAEEILNWRVERVNGRNLTILVVLAETSGRTERSADPGEDPFAIAPVEQLRVLRLVAAQSGGPDRFEYVVEIWQREEIKGRPEPPAPAAVLAPGHCVCPAADAAVYVENPASDALWPPFGLLPPLIHPYTALASPAAMNRFHLGLPPGQRAAYSELNG